MEKTVDNYDKSGPFNWSELSRSTEVGDGPDDNEKSPSWQAECWGQQSVNQAVYMEYCVSGTYCVQEL